MHFGDILLVLLAVLMSGGVIGATIAGRKFLQLLSTRSSLLIETEKAKLDGVKHHADIQRHRQTIELAKIKSENLLEAGTKVNPPPSALDETRAEREESPEVVEYGKYDVYTPYKYEKPVISDPFQPIEDAEFS